MMKAIRYVALAALTWAQLACAATPTPEQKEVTAFMHKMYSYSANMFEFGRFNGTYNPGDFCTLMGDFFVGSLIARPEKNKGCDVAFIRYPGAGSEDLGLNRNSGEMPKPKLSPPIVEGDKATVTSETKKYGRTVFFLTRTDKGWRVENAMYYDSIPTEGNICHMQFLKDPTPAQLKYRPACKDY